MDVEQRRSLVEKAWLLLPKYGGAGNGGELMALNQAALVYGVVGFDPASDEAKGMVEALERRGERGDDGRRT